MLRMLTRIPRFAAMTASLCVLALAAGCGSNKPASAVKAGCKPAHRGLETREKGNLIATITIYPPYSDIKDGVAVGVDGGLLNAVAAMECLQVKTIPMTGISGVADVNKGRADLAVGGWFRTKQRAKQVDFTNPNYLDRLVAVSKAGSGISTVDEISKYNIADYLGNTWNEEAKAVFGNKYHLFQDFGQAQDALKAGRVQVWLLTEIYAKGLAAEGKLNGYEINVVAPDTRITVTGEPSQVAWLVKKGTGDSPFVAALNEDLAKLHDDGTAAKIGASYGLPAATFDTGTPNDIK